MIEGKKIWITGQNGFVGSAVYKYLKTFYPNSKIINEDVNYFNINLIYQEDVNSLIDNFRPEIIFMTAAKVGGIQKNVDSQYQFLYDNMMIQNNIINKATNSDFVEKVVNLSSSCVYPKDMNKKITESDILTGSMEPTNLGYGLAKLSSIYLCKFANDKLKTKKFITLSPCNVYGPGDKFFNPDSHVMSAIMGNIIKAAILGKDCKIWGTGKPKREFIFIDDLARGIVEIANQEIKSDYVNIGTGVDISINDLAVLIRDTFGEVMVNFYPYIRKVNFENDTTKPDGMMNKCMDVSLIEKEYGFTPSISLKEGISITAKFIMENLKIL